MGKSGLSKPNACGGGSGGRSASCSEGPKDAVNEGNQRSSRHAFNILDIILDASCAVNLFSLQAK
jgi:hypothetical protein